MFINPHHGAEGTWYPGLGIRESIASYLPEREAPCALPFYTNFDQGVGHRLFNAGEVLLLLLPR